MNVENPVISIVIGDPVLFTVTIDGILFTYTGTVREIYTNGFVLLEMGPNFSSYKIGWRGGATYAKVPLNRLRFT